MESQKALFKRFIRNECTQLEIEGLLAEFNDADNETVLREIIIETFNDEDNKTIQLSPDLKDKEEVIYAALLPHLQQKRTISLWPQIAAAVILILGLSISFYLIKYKTDSIRQVAQQDIAPGGNKAFLTLANGRKISLTDAKNGQVASQAGVKVTKTAGGLLVYTVSNPIKPSSNAPLSYNTIETPKGGQYQVNLPDGTKVWLNAASSLKYPTSFIGIERKVVLTGEAYFEVTHDQTHPFLVKTDKETVTVLGTHFNVNAYNDESAIKTTLLEGSVRVSAGTNKIVIKPGQQATLIANKVSTDLVDTEEIIAWKNGMFQFSDESLESIMRKLSRWYNVEIEYKNNEVKSLPLTGVITHFSNISKVLRMLELTKKVHFRIEEQKIIVMK